MSKPLNPSTLNSNALPEQLAQWEICGGGYGIHWEPLDEDLSTNVARCPCPRSKNEVTA
jgi:hypothetical protein